jgi:hypothetical protein
MKECTNKLKKVTGVILEQILQHLPKVVATLE